MHAVNPQPLATLRVVEFAHVIAGPFAGLQLQQLGAQVTKIEPPRVGNDAFTGSPGSSFFECSDGTLAVGANTPAQRARLAAALGLDAAAADFGPALAVALRSRARAEAEAPVQGLAAFLAWAPDQGLLQAVEAGPVRTPGPGWRSFAAGER